MSLINKFIKLSYNYQEFDKVFYDNEFREAVDILLENNSIDDIFSYLRSNYYYDLNADFHNVVKYLQDKSKLSLKELSNKINISVQDVDIGHFLNLYSVDELLNLEITSNMSDGLVNKLVNIYINSPTEKVKEFVNKYLLKSGLIGKSYEDDKKLFHTLNTSDLFIDTILERSLNNFKSTINIFGDNKFIISVDSSVRQNFTNKILLNKEFINKMLNEATLIQIDNFFKSSNIYACLFHNKEAYDIYSYIIIIRNLKEANEFRQKQEVNNKNKNSSEYNNFITNRNYNNFNEILKTINAEKVSFNGIKKALLEFKGLVPVNLLLSLRMPMNEFNIISNKVKLEENISNSKNTLNDIKDTTLFNIYNLNNKILNLIIEDITLYKINHKNINEIFLDYIKLTNKSPESIYHESLKQNPFLLYKVSDFSKELSDDFYTKEYKGLNSFLIFPKFQNFTQYFNLLNRKLELAKEIHNDGDYLEYANTIFNNTKLDLEEDYVDDLLSVLEFLKDKENNLQKLNQIALKFKEKGTNLDVNEFNEGLVKSEKYINDFNSFNLNPSSDFVRTVKALDTTIGYVNMFDAVSKYIEIAEPKDPNLFKLEASFDGFEFKVLRDYDPLHFRIGIETDCCQRLSGAGEEAAVDSFINSLAGVLVLYKDYMLLSQSYFHYVPEDKGFILDNIEYNENNVKKFDKNIKNEQSSWLAGIYQKYGEILKEKNPEIKYLKLGTSYSKVTLDNFKPNQLLEDPREFKVEDPYTDFDESKHVDIFNKT